MDSFYRIINEISSSDVKYILLEDLEKRNIVKIGRGQIISKDDIKNNPGDYPVYSSSASGDGEIGRYGKYMFDDERITWSIDGGGKFFYRNNLKYSVTNVGGWIKVENEDILKTKYLYYCLSSLWATRVYDYTKKAHPSVIKKEYLIPVPSIEIQNKIINCLDMFLNIIENLNKEEDYRKKQFYYYMDKLYSFDGRDINISKLIDVADISRGKRVTKKDLNGEQNYPVYQNSLAPMGYYKDYNYNENNTYVISAGAAGEIGFCEKKFWAADDCLVIHNTNGVLNKYIYYYLILKQPYIISNVRKASIPRLSRNIIENIEIPIPSIEEQNNIVSILNVFSEICNSSIKGIPAEIEKRQKQYEYYRDKLLSFKEVEVNE